MKRGKVYLIGAGPGDPGLITVKGLECLKHADVIVYDHLVDCSLLELARPEAEKIYVGKEVVEKVNRAIDTDKKICAVGTTVLRTLESTVSVDNRLNEFEGWTNKFIYPPNKISASNQWDWIDRIQNKNPSHHYL